MDNYIKVGGPPIATLKSTEIIWGGELMSMAKFGPHNLKY